ncbi:MAG TPA: outer membrane protein assembly factor BamA, partial [Nitrospiria bacterium]|nr:outer membrane protein assembly factor BamA [Nitrospiria bacterium]
GLFKDIRIEAEPSANGVALRFIFTEKVFISQIRMTGHTFSTKKVLKALNLREGEEFSSETWRSALTRVLNFYHRQGYFQPQITLNTIPQIRKNTVNLDIHMQEGIRARLGKIRFVGNSILPDVLLYFTLGVAEGFYDADRVEKGLDKLNQLYQNRGYIEATIGPPELAYDEAAQEVSITIPIEAGTQVKVFFKGKFEKKTFFWRKPLESQLLIKEQRSVDVNVLEESRERLEQYFKDQGYLFVKVSYQREDQPEKELVNVTFDIDAGHPVLLMSIRFEGNQIVPTQELRKVLQTKSTGILIPRVVHEKTIEADLKALLDFYRSRGFQEPHIKSSLAFNPTKDRADLTIQIEEGIQTLVDRIDFEGNTTFSGSELLGVSGLKPLMPYNTALAQEVRYKILVHYSEKGYVYAQVSLAPELKDEKRLVDLHYLITEDQPAFVGKIFLQGNTFTEDHVILRELLIHPNDPYDEEKIRLSEHRLYRLGFLSEVRLTPISEEKGYIRDLILSVKERKAGALDFGFGYGEVERFRGFAEVSHRNLFGTGRRLSLRSELSKIEQKYTLNYKEPWFLSLAMDARAGLVYQVEELEVFDRRTTGASVGLDKSFSERTKGSVQYQFEQNKCEDIQVAAQLTSEDLQRITVGSFSPSLIRDSRDDPFNPTSGSVNGIIIKDGAKILGSEVQFVKMTLQSSWYRSMSKWLVLAISGRAGVAQKFGETEVLHCSERFFLGGRSTIRGYARDTVGVLGQTLTPELIPTGGNTMLLLNSELRFMPLKWLGIVLFMDGGNVWREYPDVKLSELKYSSGAGLRYNTPIGPLRLDWGYKLNREIGEGPSEWHFTLGHTF